MHVRAPASSANLGPGFDTLALAVDLPFEVAVADVAAQVEDVDGRSFHAADGNHPAVVAYMAAGGDPSVAGSNGEGLRWRSPIPPGRGLGFSGAARVAGAYLGLLSIGVDPGRAVARSWAIAAELEGHGDNAAASAYGGFCVNGPSGVVRVDGPPGFIDSLALVVWSPESTTSTRTSRVGLPDPVPLDVAVSSIAGAATWVAAMSTGRTDLLAAAARDRLHQPSRLAARPDSGRVLAHVRAVSGVVAAWLSGSGPSIAALVASSDAETIGRTLAAAVTPSDFPPGGGPNPAPDLPAGRVRVLRVAGSGVSRVQRAQPRRNDS